MYELDYFAKEVADFVESDNISFEKLIDSSLNIQSTIDYSYLHKTCVQIRDSVRPLVLKNIKNPEKLRIKLDLHILGGLLQYSHDSSAESRTGLYDLNMATRTMYTLLRDNMFSYLDNHKLLEMQTCIAQMNSLFVDLNEFPSRDDYNLASTMFWMLLELSILLQAELIFYLKRLIILKLIHLLKKRLKSIYLKVIILLRLV